MNVLSIGNSFSQDAQRYLHQIARAGGYNLSAVNLYIGGCPLSTHFRNMLSEEKAYLFELNGESSGLKVSIKDALLSRDWDVVTLQQASLKSPCYETYQPYISRLSEYVRSCSPKAKIAVHQTWAYEQDSMMLNVKLGYEDQARMFADLKEAYRKAAEDINADIIIPSGELMQKLLVNGISTVHRDTYHMSRGLGRYALGLLWYGILTGEETESNSFCDFDEEVSEKEISIIKKCVAEICKR